MLFVDNVDLAAPRAQAQEGNDPEPAKPPQRMPMLRGVRALTGRMRGEADVAGNNRICVWVEGWPGGRTAGHGRREQAVPPTLDWAAGVGRSEIEEARRPLDGHPTVTTLC